MIGVLALQGAFQEHVDILTRLGVSTKLVRQSTDLEQVCALIIPGGESTTFSLLLKDLKAEICRRSAKGMPVWGICAGMILLADLGLMDMQVERNAYGRQSNSFTTELEVFGKSFPGVFIRAPKVTSCGEEVEVIGIDKRDRASVAFKQGNLLATAFHPELTSNFSFHSYFIQLAL